MARRYFQDVKNGITVLQSGNAQAPSINTLSNHKVFLPKFLFSFAAIRGSLARKHFNALERKMTKTNHVKANGGPDFKLHDLVVCQNIRVFESKFFLFSILASRVQRPLILI